VDKKTASPALLTQGLVRAVLDVPSDKMQGHGPGSWRIVVQRTSGVQVPFDLTATVNY